MPLTSNCCVGVASFIPIYPVPGVTLRKVPPIPTSNPLPTVRIPTVVSNTRLDDVAKSPAHLNKTPPLSPVGLTVIVAAIPKLTASATIELPTKLS